jgi:TonB family protein
MPVFDEKDMTLAKFISQNINYPEIAYRQNISGKVLLSFIIEPQGRISNIQVLRPVGGGCTEEAVRVARLIKWNPGIKDGMAVRTNMQLEFTFRLPDETEHQILDNNQGSAL